MGLRACCLASGSAGNCIYVASGTTAILVDAGLSARETERRLAEIGGDPAALRGICLTHEHSDHVAGLALMQRRYGVPLYANADTMQAVDRTQEQPLNWNVFTTGSPFEIGDLLIDPFSVPHDAYDPVGFVIRSGAARLGVVTDAGMVTSLMRERLRQCHAVILETNHDEQMLKDARRPWSLKQRIAGRQGHLSNRTAAELVGEIAGPALAQVFLAHLSAECNRPDAALREMTRVLTQRGMTHVRLELTFRDRVSHVWVGE